MYSICTSDKKLPYSKSAGGRAGWCTYSICTSDKKLPYSKSAGVRTRWQPISMKTII